jgi:CheY-like chemotaxis protein
LQVRSTTPILAMRAKAFSENRADCLDTGMHGFIAKRVEPAALAAGSLAIFPPVARALSVSEFNSCEQDLIVGASLQVAVPTGQCDHTKIIHIATDRWLFKPEFGISKALEEWTFDGKAVGRLFMTHNHSDSANKNGSYLRFCDIARILTKINATKYGGTGRHYTPAA